MIIVPERQLVIITPPRTGSTSLLEACQLKYPLTMSPYRHMEASGVPFGYEAWRRVCIVRDPLQRLWSLYKYVSLARRDPTDWQKAVFTERSFPVWLTEEETFFGNPTWKGVGPNPRQKQMHVMPEQRKSQWFYADPVGGTEVVKLESTGYVRFLEEEHLEPSQLNVTDETRSPAIDSTSAEHMREYFIWEYAILGY